jgi:hypothetical protein
MARLPRPSVWARKSPGDRPRLGLAEDRQDPWALRAARSPGRPLLHGPARLLTQGRDHGRPAADAGSLGPVRLPIPARLRRVRGDAHEAGFTCDKAAIHAALEPLRGEARTLKIAFQFGNIPGRPDFYYYFAFQKTFFAADTFGWTDQGHHFEGSWKAPGFRETDITHVHFHNKPHELLLAHARRKLQVHVDPGDVEALRNHKGRSVHLVPYLTMSRAEYHARFDEQVQFYYPEFLALLDSLKAPIRFAEDDTSPRKRAARKSSPEQPSAQAEGALMMLPYRFDPAKYIAANPDVARAGVDPLVHFCSSASRRADACAPG